MAAPYLCPEGSSSTSGYWGWGLGLKLFCEPCDLKDLIQACLFDYKYLACCGDNPSQHISLADSGIAKPTYNTKS